MIIKNVYIEIFRPITFVEMLANQSTVRERHERRVKFSGEK